MADEPAPVFDFAGTWPFAGTPAINGHPAAAVTGFTVHADADEIPVITLKLMGAGALKLLMTSGAARLEVADESAEALKSLGWTPPDKTS